MKNRYTIDEVRELLRFQRDKILEEFEGDDLSKEYEEVGTKVKERLYKNAIKRWQGLDESIPERYSSRRYHDLAGHRNRYDSNGSSPYRRTKRERERELQMRIMSRLRGRRVRY